MRVDLVRNLSVREEKNMMKIQGIARIKEDLF